jgi:hypothetical protein
MWHGAKLKLRGREQNTCARRLSFQHGFPVMPAPLSRYADLASIVELIAHSPIVLTASATGAARGPRFELPAGYGLADILVLDWIAAETLRARRPYLPL